MCVSTHQLCEARSDTPMDVSRKERPQELPSCIAGLAQHEAAVSTNCRDLLRVSAPFKPVAAPIARSAQHLQPTKAPVSKRQRPPFPTPKEIPRISRSRLPRFFGCSALDAASFASPPPHRASPPRESASSHSAPPVPSAHTTTTTTVKPLGSKRRTRSIRPGPGRSGPCVMNVAVRDVCCASLVSGNRPCGKTHLTAQQRQTH